MVLQNILYKISRVFLKALMGGEISPTSGEEWENLLEEGFFIGWWESE